MSLSSSAPWLKYYGNVPHHLSYPQKTIYQMVKAAAERNPKLPAYEFMGKKTTFTQFMQKIDETAQAFLAMGIKKGDRVTICMPNCPQALHAFYGLNRIGAVSNMIHPLSAAGEIRFYLNFSHSKCILTLDQFYAKIAPIMPELDDPDCKLLLAKIEDELYPHLALGYALTAARKYPKPPKKGNYIWWSEFQRVGKKRDLPLPREFGKAEEGASILYSGGTTGTTKGILLSNMNFNALGLQTIAASGFSPIDGLKMLSVMPVFHGFGLGIGIHTALIGGACCILVPKFNVNTYAELLIKKQPNIIPGVPTLFEALLRAEKLENADLSCLKGVFSGGDSMSIELKKKVDDFLKAHNASVQVRQGYGLTEASPVVASNTISDYRLGSCGKIWAWAQPEMGGDYTFKDEEGNLGKNLRGQLLVKGRCVMKGYWNHTDASAKTMEGGYLNTGDVAHVDKDGYLFIHGRSSSMIVTYGGEKLHPEAIEDAVKLSPMISEAMVIGEKCKSVYVCVNVPEDLRKQHSPEELSKLLKAEVQARTADLTSYMKPKDVLLLPDFTVADGTMTATLKIRRHKIKELYRSEIEEFLQRNGEEIATKKDLKVPSSRIVESLGSGDVVIGIDTDIK